MINKIKEEDFEQEVLKSEKMVLVDFFATWCAPCQMLMPVLEKIASERNDFDIIEIDVDEAKELAMRYDIEAVPTMVIFRNGTAIDRIGGYYNKEELEEEIKKYF